MNSASSVWTGYLVVAALWGAATSCQSGGTGDNVSALQEKREPDDASKPVAAEDSGAAASASTEFPLLTCPALAAKYRACGLLGEGDFECTGHLDACTALCELQASCEELSESLCWTLDDNSPFWACLFDCVAGPGGYVCEEDSMAIPRHRFCDGVDDCAAGSDERDCPAIVCDASWSNVVTEDRICDTVEDCFAAEDEEGCPDFVCDDGSVLPHGGQCDEFFDCFDRSDERNCDLRRHTALQCADGELMSGALICDGTADCSDGSDEENCGDAGTCGGEECERNFVFVCGDGSVIPYESECDQVVDCADGSDETCSVVCADGTLVPYFATCDESVDCPDGSDEANCEYGQCDGFRDRNDWSDESGCCDNPPCAELTECAEPLPDF